MGPPLRPAGNPRSDCPERTASWVSPPPRPRSTLPNSCRRRPLPVRAANPHGTAPAPPPPPLTSRPKRAPKSPVPRPRKNNRRVGFHPTATRPTHRHAPPPRRGGWGSTRPFHPLRAGRMHRALRDHSLLHKIRHKTGHRTYSARGLLHRRHDRAHHLFQQPRILAFRHHADQRLGSRFANQDAALSGHLFLHCRDHALHARIV